MRKIYVYGDVAVINDDSLSTSFQLADKPDEIVEYNQENLEKYGLTKDHAPKKSVVQSNK